MEEKIITAKAECLLDYYDEIIQVTQELDISNLSNAEWIQRQIPA